MSSLASISAAALTALLTLTTALTGCTASPSGAPGPSAKADEADPDGDAKSDPPPSTSGGTSEGSLAVVTIDVQKVFFDTATARNAKNVTGRMENTARVFELAGTHHVPLFLTFEDSKSGDHALPSQLSAALPKDAKEHIKTTFAATSQPQFKSAIESSGVKRVLVFGAETDVCVMQTMLGLRRMGIEVVTVDEGLFTEEVNNGPALRRLRQAGVVEIGMPEAEALLASGGTAATPSPPASKPPTIVEPLAMGIFLHAVDGLSAADPNSSAKMVRLRELLLISEWFRLPVFAADPAAATAALPANLKSILTRPITTLAQRPSNIKQLAVAGGHAGIADAAAGLMQGGDDVFLVEDAMLGGGSADLEPLYVAGAVPTTYKALYYELTQSVADDQWPSQQWVKDGDKYWDLTKAPEDLPPLVITP